MGHHVVEHTQVLEDLVFPDVVHGWQVGVIHCVILSWKSARTVSQDSQPGQSARTVRQDSQSGQSARTVSQDSQSGQSARTVSQDSQPGQSARTVSQDSQCTASGNHPAVYVSCLKHRTV